MAAVTNMLAGRVILAVVAVHAVLLPAIYFALLHVTTTSHQEVFINEVRSYARFLADEIELSGLVTDAPRLKRLLDSAILRGDGVFAEIEVDGVRHASDLNVALAPGGYRGEDFALGDGGDTNYYLAVPLNQAEHRAQLRLGFDERWISDKITQVQHRIVMILSVYFAASMLLAIVLARLLARPLVELGSASRAVASGEVTRRVETTSRIGELRRLAEDMEFMRGRLVDMSASLRQQIAEREAARAEQRALEAQLRQRQKLEELGTLAGGIAHEFNNVLVPIILFAEAALDELPHEHSARNDVQQIRLAAQRARDVIRQIMFFSRRIEQVHRPMQLEPVVRATLQLMRAMVPANVELTMSLRPDAGAVWSDPALIGQIVLNLCTNALQALRPAGGRLEVTLDDAPGSPGSETGRLVHLAVEDTGHGMSEQVLARIFEPFFTTRPVGEGTGLGLSVVHGIVQSLGGTINVSSTPGRGSRFELYFAAVDAATAATDPPGRS